MSVINMPACKLSSEAIKSNRTNRLFDKKSIKFKTDYTFNNDNSSENFEIPRTDLLGNTKDLTYRFSSELLKISNNLEPNSNLTVGCCNNSLNRCTIYDQLTEDHLRYPYATLLKELNQKAIHEMKNKKESSNDEQPLSTVMEALSQPFDYNLPEYKADCDNGDYAKKLKHFIDLEAIHLNLSNKGKSEKFIEGGSSTMSIGCIMASFDKAGCVSINKTDNFYYSYILLKACSLQDKVSNSSSPVQSDSSCNSSYFAETEYFSTSQSSDCNEGPSVSKKRKRKLLNNKQFMSTSDRPNVLTGSLVVGNLNKSSVKKLDTPLLKHLLTMDSNKSVTCEIDNQENLSLNKNNDCVISNKAYLKTSSEECENTNANVKLLKSKTTFFDIPGLLPCSYMYDSSRDITQENNVLTQPTTEVLSSCSAAGIERNNTEPVCSTYNTVGCGNVWSELDTPADSFTSHDNHEVSSEEQSVSLSVKSVLCCLNLPPSVLSEDCGTDYVMSSSNVEVNLEEYRCAVCCMPFTSFIDLQCHQMLFHAPSLEKLRS